MCGEQKAGEKSQRNVVVVKDVGVIFCAAFSFTQKHLQGYIQLLDINEFKCFNAKKEKKTNWIAFTHLSKEELWYFM